MTKPVGVTGAAGPDQLGHELLYGLNIITVSAQDLDKVKALPRGYLRALCGLVSGSQPEEVAALVLMQTIKLG